MLLSEHYIKIIHNYVCQTEILNLFGYMNFEVKSNFK